MYLNDGRTKKGEKNLFCIQFEKKSDQLMNNREKSR